MSRLFGDPRQNGYVVQSVDRAIDDWVRAGVGPFFVVDALSIDDFVYLDEPHPIEMRVGLANNGPLQIEVIELLSAGPSDFHKFQETHGEGLHHIAYWAQDFEEQLAYFKSKGYGTIQSGSTLGGGRFLFVDTEGHAGSRVEFTEIVDGKARLFDAVYRASLEWDGSDPVRPWSAALDDKE